MTSANINSDSSTWGIYNNVTRTISSDKAKQSTNYGNTWTAITGMKSTGNVLLTKGASEETIKLNIYDFAGNEWEWTLEQATYNSKYPCADRGGSYSDSGFAFPVSYRDNIRTTYSDSSISFRATLYVN